MEKGKLRHNQMIQQLEDKGIVFEKISKKDAEEYLIDKNYYYKLTSYRKNYEKVDGQYQNLDFAHLVDLSSIDMRLRYHILKMALDIEHSIKTKLLKSITDNRNEDGYSIVSEFRIFDKRNYDRTIKVFSMSEYLSDMYQKRKNKIPAWVFIEIMSFGTLSKFVALYTRKYKVSSLKVASSLLRYSRHLRNLAAHSNALLVNIYGEKNLLKDERGNVRAPSAQVVTYAAKFSISRRELMHNKPHDLFCLFKLHKTYASEAIQENRLREFKEILVRIDRNKDYYADNENLITFFELLKKLAN